MGSMSGRGDCRDAGRGPWVTGAFVAVLAGAVLLTWVVVRAATTEPVPWVKPAEVDGAVVRLTYMGSECRDGASVDVEEDAGRVVLTVHETVYSRSCSDVGVTYDHEVRLDEPLGERELVDGACLVEELSRRSACR
ncbi:hypothetical protein [Nocardioides sp. Soil777]|uniref:hypothetical protein n=1 Tax=Nocardioides sp. Soil777 TaxID=1736409 RepID=UPI0012F733D7|nr:hypothetical protein [Nocardioides sp. Soil777]